jgi:hypothetical protein
MNRLPDQAPQPANRRWRFHRVCCLEQGWGWWFMRRTPVRCYAGGTGGETPP